VDIEGESQFVLRQAPEFLCWHCLTACTTL